MGLVVQVFISFGSNYRHSNHPVHEIISSPVKHAANPASKKGRFANLDKGLTGCNAIVVRFRPAHC
jgi:hypothetical protein